MNRAGNLVATIFIIIAVPCLTLFQLRTCMNYVFQKSMEQQNFREAENHSIFSKILYLYPWKYIKRHRVIFAWIQSMYFIGIGSIAALGKVIISEYINTKSFIQVLNDFQQRCYEQDIENTEEIINYYHEMLEKHTKFMVKKEGV